MIKFAVAVLFVTCGTQAFTQTAATRTEAEYYVRAYARHYDVPVPLVRAIVQQESGWKPCVVSRKGAVGLMQLMPMTAIQLRVTRRCDIEQNISGGVRYLAWLIRCFHGDLRLATAAFYAGQRAIEKRGLACRNADVVRYVAQIRFAYQQQRNRFKE